MPTIEITLRDDAGQVIDGRSVKKYPLDCKMKTFHDIEGAVETFKRRYYRILKPICWKQRKKSLLQVKKRPGE